MRSINLNRVSGRILAVLVLLFSLSIGNAWAGGGGSTYYSRVGVKVASGSGTVYAKGGATSASASSNDVNTTGTSFVYTSDQSSSTQNETKNFAVCAVPATDYRFDKWTFSGDWNSKPTAANASTYGNIKCASSSSGNSATTGTAAATFLQISIASANKTSVTLNPTDARTSCNDYTGTVVFTTTNDNASSQIGTPSFGSKSGSGTWEATNSWAAGTSTVTYTFKGNGYYGGSGTASGSRNNSATLTLPTAGGTSSKSVTFTANFPALVIADGETDVVSPKGPTDDGDGAVTFDVTYFDGLFDIANVVISEETGGTWTLGSMSYEQTNAATGAGVVTVPFTFNAGGATGDFSAKLTLTPATNTEASAKEVTLSAHVDDLSTNDASVTPAGGSATEYATFAEALAAANASDGCTLKLLRDVSGLTTSQEVKKTMTLDLNRYSLSGTLSAAGGLLKLNTAGKVLTITDTQAGGSISVSGNIDGRIAAVEVLQGSLILTKGDLIAENANTGTTLANIYAAGVYLGAGATMGMTGGIVTANRTGASGNYCFGIYCAGTGSSASSVNLTGGTVTATFPNGSYAEGVFAAGNSIISNMTVTASSKTTCYAIRVEDGHLVVNGGIFTATTTNQEARGLYSMNAPSNKNAVVVNNATFNVTAGTTDARGIWCRSTTTTMSDDNDPTDANVILSGVTVNAKTDETTGTTDAYAIMSDAGVCLGIQSGTYTATTKTQNTYALHTSGYTAVVDGTFNANSTTRTAFAIYVNGGITAVKAGTFTASAATAEVHATKILANAKLLTYGGTFRGICTNVASDGWATGSQVMSTGTLEAQGGTFVGEINKAGLTAAQTGCACGIYANTGSNVTLSNATLQGKANNKWLNGGATTTYYGTHGLLTKTTNKLTLTNCTISATSAYQYAFGIRALDTPVEIKNCTVSVDTDYPYNYGIYTYGAANVEASNSTFTCISQQTYAYGSYVANGTLIATDCKFTVKALQNNVTSATNNYLRGIYVAASKKATLNSCTIDAQGNSSVGKEGYGLYVDGSADVDNCTITVSGINTGAYAIVNSANTSFIGIASGKFKATATTTGVSTNGTAAAAKQQLYGGYYSTINNLEKYLPEGYGIETLASTSPEYGEGYRYAIRPSTNLNPVCKIGSTPYYTLEEALEFVNKNSSTAYTILMTADYTLPAGDYILPTNATLLVPKKDQTTLESHPSRVSGGTAWATPTCNRKLTFAANAHLVVLGKIQTGGVQAAVNQMPGHNGVPRDTYGHIVLNTGSTITLESGSHLYSWGYVTGAGTIDAKRGSTVHECLQIRDWRGGTCTSNMNGNSNKVFPLNQYFIQNIESAITFHPGSAEKCDGTVNARTSILNSTPKAYTFEDVNLIGVSGSSSLFMMDNEDNSADTWVRKYYDTTNDMQVYELNSSAYLGSLSLSLYGISFNSVSYVLPLTNNMHIHLLTGEMHVTQDTEVLPGAIIEVDKEATAYVDAGKSLYLFDADEWNIFSDSDNDKYFYLLAYSATLGKAPTARSATTKPADAALNIHGKFVINGAIYTTASGANIYSSDEDAGTVKFNVAASTEQKSVYVNNTTSGSSMTARPSNSAYLKNGDGTYEHTAGTASGKSWIYYDGKWNCWEEKNCFGYDKEDNPYAKPRAWVQLTSDVADPTTHLYADAETGNRRFLVEDDCTWWEVEPTPYDGNKYKCVDPDYDGRYKYYEYVNNKWQEAKVTITWKNGSTTIATYSNALYGVSPKYLEGTPSKTATSSEYYTWMGWTKDDDEEGEFFAKEEELPFATANTTYYAKFETHKYSYAVTFKNYDGSVLQTTSWEAGQVPYYLAETDPVKPATAALVYSFTGWDPAITAVTGAGKVYTAQFESETRTYTVQWVNYNGTVLKEEQVAYGATPSEPVTPTRPNDTYYTYTFNEWTPAPSAVTGNQTYTATYNYEKKVTKYDIKFNNGSTTLYTQSLPNGETPVYGGSTPTKDDEQYTYTFDGWSATDGGDKLTSLPAVSGATTYYAVFTKELKTYTIRWKSVDDKQAYETDTDVPYGTMPSYDGDKPTKARQGATVFTFDGWSATKGGDKIELPNVTGNATYYAHFTDDPVYTVEFDMQGHGSAPAVQEVVKNQHVIEPAAPAIAEWIFGGWYKEAACTNAWNFSTDVVTANTTLYAKWTLATATVTNNSGTTNHTTIADAFATANSAASASTITVMQDATVGSEGVTYSGSQNCTLDLNGQTMSCTSAGARLLIISCAGATFTITDNTEDELGKVSLTTSNTTTGPAFCVYVTSGTLQLEAGTISLYSTSTNRNAVAVRVDGGNFIMNGGTAQIEVTQSGRSGYAMQSLGSAEITVNDGTAIAKADNGYAYGTYVTGTMTVNGGKFHLTGQNPSVAYTTATSENYKKLLIKGGYYNTNANLATYVAPGKSGWNYYAFAITDEEKAEVGNDYTYKVAEAYTVRFNNHNGTQLQSGLVEKGTTPTYNGTTPTKDQTEEWVYTHNGWTPTIESVTDDAIYTATFSQAKRKYAITWKNKDDNTLRTDHVEYGKTPDYGSTPTYGPTTQQVFEFRAWTPDVVDVTGAATYTADYTASPRLYPVVWKNYDGNPLKETTRKYGWNDVPTADAYDGETPVRPSSNGKTYTFSGWSDPVSEVTDGDVTYTAQYSCTASATEYEKVTVIGTDTVTSVTVGGEDSKLTIGDTENPTEVTTTVTVVSDGGELVVSEGSSIKEEEEQNSVVIVEAGGQLTVEKNASVEANVFELIATHETTTQTNEYDAQVTTSTYSSGQVDGNGTIGDAANETMKAFFKLSHNGGFKARQWYAVAVPWQIAVPTYAEGGVSAYQDGAYKSIKLGSDYDLVRYDGGIRAVRGNVQDCWVYVEDDIDIDHKDAVMHPGVFYMIYLAHEADTIRFERASGTAFRYNANVIELAVQNNDPETASGNDNWNGIANPTMHYAYVNANAHVGQQYVVDEEGHGSYDQIDLTSNALIVGMPVFVQTISESVVVNKDRDVAFSAPSGAPRRVSGNEVWNTQKIEVQLVPTGLSYSDRIFIQTEQGKADRYTIGADVAKAGVSAYKAQMWVDRYDYQLCYNTVAPVNNSASYPLGISIPKAGEYAISVPADCLEGDMVYLTYDGRLIWNLSYAPYSVSLEKGTNTHYGIKLVRSNAPAVTTGIDSVDELQYPAVQKIIMENQVYILRNNNVYSVDGQLVK